MNTSIPTGCGKCHECGSTLRFIQPDEGEAFEWCDFCGIPRKYAQHGFAVDATRDPEDHTPCQKQ